MATKRFRVKVSIEEPSFGEVIVDAENAEEAEALALEMDVNEFNWEDDEPTINVLSVEEDEEEITE